MQIILNGKPSEQPESLTIRDLIERLGLARAICAVEVNSQVIPRAQHDSCPVQEHDNIEIVTLVGGG
ncbi:MAG: sulfur carrier protein ThiS [Leptolyngbya sp. PLA3]|nr:MAG: sulfur carrier protein ThiS [Cyanobacteria bacterium CYA]MCE7968773.1 sulfur carrier protein ThiS [Leptolyngbya sp. PL-A3]